MYTNASMQQFGKETDQQIQKHAQQHGPTLSWRYIQGGKMLHFRKGLKD